MSGPLMAATLAIGAPAGAAPMLIPCDGCALSPATTPMVLRARHRLSAAALSYDGLSRVGRAAASGLSDRWSARVYQAGDSGLSIETMRRVAHRIRPSHEIGARRDRLSSGSMTLRYASDAGGEDSLSLGLNAAMEKRRFALDLARGRQVRGQSIGLATGWTHDGGWRLEGGYRFDIGGGGASMAERGIELAEGAPRTQHGAWTALGYTIGSAERPGSISFGGRVQTFRLGGRDRLALGAQSATDARLAFTTSLRFR